jgi:hypothetical protein
MSQLISSLNRLVRRCTRPGNCVRGVVTLTAIAGVGLCAVSSAFTWTKTADQIIEKVQRGRATLDAITN